MQLKKTQSTDFESTQGLVVQTNELKQTTSQANIT